MLTKALLPLLALAGSAFALQPAAAVAFGQTLAKRQTSSSDLSAATEAATTLATNAAAAISSGGKCSDECSAMITAMTGCTSGSDQVEQAQCICGDATMNSVGGCGSCLGGESDSAADQLKSICTENAALISSAANSSGASNTASGTSSAPSASATSADAGSGASTLTSLGGMAAAGVAGVLALTL